MANANKALKTEPKDHLESERKEVLAGMLDPGVTTQDIVAIYRPKLNAIFQDVIADRATFPDLSYVMDKKTQRRRAVNYKDNRIRIYLSDIELALTNENTEIRHELFDGVLMIKHGNGSSDSHPTMNRIEKEYNLDIPFIGSLNHIKKHSRKNKDVPQFLTEKFDTALKILPHILTDSSRDKLVYYRPFEVKKGKARGQYRIAFEIARDEGIAMPLLGESYALDQIEIEVKKVMSGRINILDAPEHASKLSLKTIQNNIIEPAFEQEQEMMSKRFDLVPIHESKPTHGFEEHGKHLSHGSENKVIRKKSEKVLKSARQSYKYDDQFTFIETFKETRERFLSSLDL